MKINKIPLLGGLPLMCGKVYFCGIFFIMLFRKAAILLLVCTTTLQSFPQRYGFINYNTDEGLLQSQVYDLMQASDGQLWMTTMGGISRFDGKTFYNYTTREGLTTAFPIHCVIDFSQRIWAISNEHLNLIAGNKVYTYPLPQKVSAARARLGVTPDNILWVLINGTLYSFKENKFVKEEVEGFTTQDFRALIPGEKNTTWLMAPNRNLYGYKNGNWYRYSALKFPDPNFRIRHVYVDTTGVIWIETPNSLMVQRERDGELLPWFSLKNPQEYFNCIIRDKQGNFWMGTNIGAYKLRPDKSFIYFNNTNGFSNFSVNAILNDKEGNIWLGTNGDGLVKFPGAIFTAFNSGGNQSTSQMQVVTNDRRGNVMFGNTGEDFCIYDGNTLRFPLKNSAAKEEELYHAYEDSLGAIWLATGTGLWKYEKGNAHLVGANHSGVLEIIEDGGRLFLGAGNGVFVLENGILKRHNGLDELIGKIIMVGKDSLLVARRSGIALLKDTVKLTFKFPAALEQSAITAFEKKGNKIFIGTVGEGIFVWDKSTGHFDQVSTSHGLATNMIYSLIFDHTGNLWAGTGNGVIRISSTDEFKTVSVRNYDKEQGFYGSETYAKAVAVMPDNSVWFGTTKGLFRYNPAEDLSFSATPTLTLQTLKLFSKPLTVERDSGRTGYPASTYLPANLVLPAGENHLTFEFKAVSYVYSNIQYSYLLEGLETKFSEPDFTNFVAYPSLPPGKYVFKVKAMDYAGKQLCEMVSYSFSIKPAIYQAFWFKILLALTVIGLIFLLYRLRQMMQRKKQVLVEMLRTEEQSKIRKKTAQDFHDEMGNKLARIGVLSDILKSKLPLHDETQGLAKKIEENVAQIYQGTKDIIWSLNPENDNLQYLLTYINNIGIDFFVDTDIEYDPMTVNESFHQFYLPMDHARNMIMICKEVFTNTAKHAQCTQVTTEVEWVEKNKLQLIIKDNGKGFNTAARFTGNGLGNIKQRAGNLQADMQLQSEAGKGTCLAIIFKVSKNGHSK